MEPLNSGMLMAMQSSPVPISSTPRIALIKCITSPFRIQAFSQENISITLFAHPIQQNAAPVAIYHHRLTILHDFQQARDVDHRREAKLASHYRAMREVASGLHHHCTGSQEQRRPARIGGRRDQNLSGLQQVSFAGVANDACPSRRLTRGSGDTVQLPRIPAYLPSYLMCNGHPFLLSSRGQFSGSALAIADEAIRGRLGQPPVALCLAVCHQCSCSSSIPLPL